MKAEQWQAEWQKGMEEKREGVCSCRQVVLIGELAEAQRQLAAHGYPVADCEIEPGPRAITFEKSFCDCGRQLVSAVQLLARQCEFCQTGAGA